MCSNFPSINQGHSGDILDLTQIESDVTWYFLGDVHGDPRCLSWAFQYLSQQHDFRFCFLGDLFDRGPQERKCLQLFIQFADTNPGQVFWIAGNHDVPHYSKPKIPITDNPAMNGYEEELSRLPVMAWFPSGIIATHGGWSMVDFHTPPLPAAQLTPEKKWILQTSRLDQLSTECDETDLTNLPCFGLTDLPTSRSIENKSDPFKLLIRGHDHPMDGYHLVSERNHPAILTLMGSTQLGVQFIPEMHRSWTTLAVVKNWQLLNILRIDSHANASVVYQAFEI